MPPERDIDIYPRRISFPGSLPNYSMFNMCVPRWELLEDDSFQYRAEMGMMTATYRHMLEKKLSKFHSQERILQSIFKGPLCTRGLSKRPQINPGKVFKYSTTLKTLLIILRRNV